MWSDLLKKITEGAVWKMAYVTAETNISPMKSC